MSVHDPKFPDPNQNTICFSQSLREDLGLLERDAILHTRRDIAVGLGVKLDANTYLDNTKNHFPIVALGCTVELVSSLRKNSVMVLGDGYATLIENVGPAVDAHDIEHETAL